MVWLALAALAAAACLLVLLMSNGARGFVRRAEARWPAEGEFLTDAQGRSIHVREAGARDGPPVLLIHGALANMRELWGPLAPLATDYRLIAYDRPGLGYSTRKRGDQTLAQQAQVAAFVLRSKNAAPALIVAHSLGCAVALRVALDFPQLVRGLVLVAPASHPYPGPNAWWAQLAATPLAGSAFSELFVPTVGPLTSRAGVANNFAPSPAPDSYWDDGGVGLAFRPRAFRASAQDVIATRAEFAAQAPRYGEILTPAIIVASDRDQVASTRLHARALSVELGAAELVTAPGAGHMPHRLRTDLVLAAVRRVDSMAVVSVE